MVNLSNNPQKYNFFQTDIRGQNLSDSVQAQLAFLNRAGVSDKKIAQKVAQMFSKIQKQGEIAIRSFAKKFDGVLGDFKIPEEKILASLEQVSPEFLNAIKLAEKRIRNYYEGQLKRDKSQDVISDGISVTTHTLPLESAGIYIPGGNAKYPSSVLMNVIPAQVAGVSNIIIATPPNSQANSQAKMSSGATGEISSEVLAAACILGVRDVYAIGGAQAIAAMAFGYCLPKVDIICGPGNGFVAEAQKLAAATGLVRVPPASAGPSEIAIIADSTTNHSFAALDLLAQMEHGAGGWAWIVSWDEKILSQINEEVSDLIQNGLQNGIQNAIQNGQPPPDIYAVLVDDPAQAVSLTNLSAPEHLQVNCQDSAELAGKIKNAGAIFCGNNTATALGDYVAGPSHTLPTGGSARFVGAVGISDFQKTINIIASEEVGPTDLLEAAITLAEAEGLKMHAESLRARLNQK